MSITSQSSKNAVFGVLVGVFVALGGVMGGGVWGEGGGKGAGKVEGGKGIGKGDADDERKGVDAEVVKWLELLEKRGKTLKSLKANFVMKQEDVLTSDVRTRLGKAAYVPGMEVEGGKKQAANFAVGFTQDIVDKRLTKVREDYIFDGVWLVERHPKKKRFIKRQIVAPGADFDPLEPAGPFFVPIGQKVGDVLSRYDVEILPVEQGRNGKNEGKNGVKNERNGGKGAKKGKNNDPVVRMRLKGKKDAKRGKSKVKTIEIFIDKKLELPVKVVTFDKRMTITIEFKKIELDQFKRGDAIAKRLFNTATPGAGWNVTVEPWRGK